MKTYSSKANARRAAKKEGFDLELLDFVEVDGKWGWKPALTKEERIDAEYQEKYGCVVCPHCGVHLSNGVGIHQQEVNGTHIQHEEFEFECLACGGEFGPAIHKGIKIEKDRPEQNGITRPSIGGKCRAIWDACDELYQEGKGVIPLPKHIKELAVERDWNMNNAIIEMYQWRKFHGIIGRQK